MIIPNNEHSAKLQYQLQLAVLISALRQVACVAVVSMLLTLTVVLLTLVIPMANLSTLGRGAVFIMLLLNFWNGYFWLRVSFDQRLFMQLQALSTSELSSQESGPPGGARVEEAGLGHLAALDQALVSFNLMAKPPANVRNLSMRGQGAMALAKRLLLGCGLQMLAFVCLIFSAA
ncbi:hypothetical protein [Motilimonas pumila]|nr:hypothetical protein [Motilimonas pumila]